MTYQYPPPPPPPGGRPATRRSAAPWLVACFGVIVLLCCAGGTGATLYLTHIDGDTATYAGPTEPDGTEPDGTDWPTPDPTGPPAPEESEEPTEEPTDDPPGVATPGTVPKDVVYRGTGDKTVRLAPSTGVARTAAFTYTGSGNFTVWTKDAAGEPQDLIVNAIGRYTGVRPLDFDSVPHSLLIESSGAWTIAVRAFSKTPLWTGGARTAKTAAVLRIDPTATAGPLRVKLTHSGRSNFIVIVYGNQLREHLVNMIGRYSATLTLPNGTTAVAVDTDGTWTISKT